MTEFNNHLPKFLKFFTVGFHDVVKVESSPTLVLSLQWFSTPWFTVRKEQQWA